MLGPIALELPAFAESEAGSRIELRHPSPDCKQILRQGEKRTVITTL